MELEQIFIDNPQLNKITEQIINDISLEKLGIILNYNKTFGDNGFDDLDCVELAMELEKRLDIVIPDDILDFLFNVSKRPPRFLEYFRSKKLNDLGI